MIKKGQKLKVLPRIDGKEWGPNYEQVGTICIALADERPLQMSEKQHFSKVWPMVPLGSAGKVLVRTERGEDIDVFTLLFRHPAINQDCDISYSVEKKRKKGAIKLGHVWIKGK